MTTNLSRDQIELELNRANEKDGNIKISYKIHSSVDFLDVIVTNEDGQLKTSIFHKPAAEPYILPYTSDHPRHVHRNIPYAALLRAARICSNVHDFDMERIRTEMSLLLNGYSASFIAKHFNRFYELNNAMPVLKQLNAQSYNELHHKLLHQPTRREKQLQSMTGEDESMPVIMKKQKPWDRQVMYPSYKFETGPRIALNHRFHQWWREHYVFPQSRVADVKINVRTKTNITLENVFVHKRPSKQLLTRMENG